MLVGNTVPNITSLVTHRAFQKVGEDSVKWGLLLAFLIQPRFPIVNNWAVLDQCVISFLLQDFHLLRTCEEGGIPFDSTS